MPLQCKKTLLVFCFSILCCCPPATQWRSRFLIIAGLRLLCIAVTVVTVPSPAMAYSCQCLCFNTSDHIIVKTHELDQVCICHLGLNETAQLNQSKPDTPILCLLYLIKDATQIHMSKPKSTQYVEKTSTNLQDCFGLAERTRHLIMAPNGKGKRNNYNTVTRTYESSSRFNTT